MIVTKHFLKAIKSADSLVLRFNETFTTIETGEKLKNGTYYNETFDFSAIGQLGCWVVSGFYSNMVTETNSPFKLLRAGDKIKFFVEDYSTDKLKSLGIFSDVLIMQITRYRKDQKTISALYRFILDIQTSEIGNLSRNMSNI